MKTLALALSVSTLALAMTACAPGKAPELRTRLDCPKTEGKLNLTGTAADGKSCTYSGPKGAEVTLKLIPVVGSADATLKAIQAELMGPVVAAPAVAATEADGTKHVDAKVKITVEKSEDGKVVVNKTVEGDSTHIDLPGVKIDATEGGATGDSAKVSLPGIHIDADDEGAEMKIGAININAEKDEVKVSSLKEVRLRGEALSRERRGIRSMFMYTGKNLPGGLRFVGYEASGPKTGPLAVAIVRSKLDSEDHGSGYDDLKRLVRRNGGA